MADALPGAAAGPAVAGGTPAPASQAAPPRPLDTVDVPAGWLLDRGSDAVRARTLLDLAVPPLADDAAEAARRIALGHAPALRLALGQHRDGTWPGGLLTVPPADAPAVEGAGMLPALRRLLEYGWPADAPPFVTARRLLFRLLAEDADPTVLYELRAEASDEPRARAARRRVREGAGAVLAQLGFESDPRLRGLAVRTLERVVGWLRAVDRMDRSAAGVPTLPAPLPEDAAPPSAQVLLMLAHMPRFRSEQTDAVARLVRFLATPAPAGVPKQRVGTQAVPHPHIALGDPVPVDLEPTGKSLLPALAWLEVLARIGAFRRTERWRPVLERLLDARDAEGRWTARVSLPAPDPFVWPTIPLGDPASPASRTADVTFRLALIARHAGYPLALR